MSEQTRPDVEAIITKYLELRDGVEAINAKAKADAAALKEAMSGIEAYMMKMAIETGQTNFGVKGVGTAFITTETHCSVADWNAVLEFAKENDSWDMLTKGVSKTVVAQYLEKNEKLPPGINWSSQKVIQIRRGKQ